MMENAGGRVPNAKSFIAVGVGLAAAAAAFFSLGTATASAEVKEIAPRPNVTSRQATVIDQNALRRTAQGEARGSLGNSRSAGNGGVTAQGEVRDSVIAVPGTSSAPFLVPQNGQFRSGAPIGSW
jgi:hypothetical protein